MHPELCDLVPVFRRGGGDLDWDAGIPHRLIAAPVETVRDVCRHFGYAFGPDYETRARRWLAENPQHKHGVHRYRLSDFGLAESDVERHFAGYRGWLASHHVRV